MRYRGVFRWFRDDTIMLGDSDLSVVFASLCYFQNFQFDFFGSSIFFLQFGEIKQIKMGENRNNGDYEESYTERRDHCMLS